MSSPVSYLRRPEARHAEAPQRPPVALKLAGVERSFGAARVLSKLDLEIRQGEVVAIIGRSGCGKSTLLRLLAGLDHADAGTLAWRDAPLAQQTGEIRLMFQEPRLLPWKSVLDNAALGVDRKLAQAALDEVGLGGRERDWPSQLSGGQRSRVALARALAHSPQLLLLDEPLGALDALTRSAMHQLIERLWRQHGFTLVLVTHDVAEAVTLADRVILLDQGRVELDLDIDLPRPRSPTDPRLIAYEATLLERLTGEERDGAEADVPLASIEPGSIAI